MINSFRLGLPKKITIVPAGFLVQRSWSSADLGATLEHHLDSVKHGFPDSASRMVALLSTCRMPCSSLSVQDPGAAPGTSRMRSGSRLPEDRTRLLRIPNAAGGSPMHDSLGAQGRHNGRTLWSARAAVDRRPGSSYLYRALPLPNSGLCFPSFGACYAQ